MILLKFSITNWKTNISKSVFCNYKMKDEENILINLSQECNRIETWETHHFFFIIWSEILFEVQFNQSLFYF
jgi:hypothetical protein